jgi:hypothetical protein
MSVVGLNESQVVTIHELLGLDARTAGVEDPLSVNVRQRGGRVIVTVYDDEGCPRGRYDITSNYRGQRPRQIPFTRRERFARWWLFRRGWAGREIERGES